MSRSVGQYPGISGTSVTPGARLRGNGHDRVLTALRWPNFPPVQAGTGKRAMAAGEAADTYPQGPTLSTSPSGSVQRNPLAAA